MAKLNHMQKKVLQKDPETKKKFLKKYRFGTKIDWSRIWTQYLMITDPYNHRHQADYTAHG